MAGTFRYGEELSGSINAGNFLTSVKVYWLASQEGLCSMEYSRFKKYFVQIYSVVYALSFADRRTGTLLASDFTFIL